MKALSPLISMVLVIAFGVAAMIIVLTVVNPMLDRAKDSAIVNEATQNMLLIDSVVKAIASEANGSKRSISITLTEGVLRADKDKEWVYIDFEPRTDYEIDGFSGDVKIVSRPLFLEFFNHYSDNSNANDTWTALNGTWTIDSGRFKGTGGIAYTNLGNLKDFDFTGDITRSVGPAGQIFAIPGEPRDLVLFLPLDEGSGTTAYDYSPYSNNGTLTNNPAWTTGKFGNATEFNGSTAYVNVPDSSSLDITDQITVEAWVEIP